MADRIKLYLVSLQGIHVKNLPAGKQLVTTRHYPLIVDGGSAAEAKENACIQVRQMFPASQGWTIRNGTIRPIPPAYYTHLLSLAPQLAQSRDPIESAELFMCDDYAPRSEDVVILEFDKPPA